MGESYGLVDDILQVSPTPIANNLDRCVVLLGRTGNGKSATGNSILGRKAFKSTLSSSGVTETCELQSTVLKDGSLINVIDTPGLFDFSDGGSESIGKEIVRCIDLAKNGIHAFLVVFSVRTRFSQEEGAVLKGLKALFGSSIVNYMIAVFTGGDDLDDMGKTLDEYLGQNCPDPLKEIITHCENRVVLFNNKTDNALKRAAQFQQLCTLVNIVIAENEWKPYTHKLFVESRKKAIELREAELKAQLQIKYEEKLRGVSQTVEAQMSETSKMLEKQILEEKEACAIAERIALEADKKAREAISKVQADRKRAEKDFEKQLLKEKAAREKAEKMALEAKARSNVAISDLHRDLQNTATRANRAACVIL